MCCNYTLQLLEPLPSDYVRESLLTMSTHSCFDGQEKLCLLQVLSLLHNLEAISQDQELSFDDANFNSISVSAQKLMDEQTNNEKKIMKLIFHFPQTGKNESILYVNNV